MGVLSLAGFALGAFLGTRLAPLVLSEGAHSPYAPLFGLLGALVVGVILAVVLEGFGVAVRRRLRIPGFAMVDGVLGAVLTACVALGVAWIAGAAALQAPGRLDPAPRHPALADPAQPQRDPAAHGADPQRALAPGPDPADPRAPARRGAAEVGHPARPADQAGARQRRARARHRLRAERRRLGLGGRHRRRGDQRPRRRGGERHHGRGRRRPADAQRDHDLLRPLQRRGGAAGARTAAPGAGLWPRARGAARPARSWAIRRTGPSGPPRRVWG